MVLLKLKKVYELWLLIYKNFPRVEREGMGHEIDQSFIKLLKLTFKASFSDPKTKIPILASAREITDEIKFLLQYTWELKFVHTPPYSEVAMLLEEIGAMFYKWRCGLESKLPSQTKLL